MPLRSDVLILGSLAVAIYAPVVIILWRNVPLSQPWKTVFAVSALPIFVPAMVVNIWLVDTYTPWLFELLNWANNTDKLRMSPLVSFLISSPFALLITGAWYLLLRSIDNAKKFEDQLKRYF